MLKVGIIGVGAIGKVHADAYQKAEGVAVAALADINAKALKAEAARVGVDNCYADWRKMLAGDIDAVSVCGPNSLHRDMAVAALQADKHVLVEKPMAMNAQEAQEIVDAAKKSKGVLQVAMVWRQNLQAQTVREYVEKGLMGEIYHLRAVMMRRRGVPGLGGWFTNRALSGGGPMIDLGVHWFDLAMWVSGHWNPTSVSAQTYAKFGSRMEDYNYVSMWAGPPKHDGVFDVEDYSTGFVRFADHATMSFEITWAGNAPEEGYVEVLGDKGGARITGQGELKILTEHEGHVADIVPYPREGELGVGFDAQARKFAATCRGEMPPAATGEQGVIVMKLIDAIYASAEAHAEVPINV